MASIVDITSQRQPSSPNATVILVTGSNGLVGEGLQQAVQSLTVNERDKCIYFFTTREDANLEVGSECNDLFDRVKPKIVIHLAACVGGLYANMSRPVDFFERNMIMQINIMRASKKCGSVKRIVSCLSTCIFPETVQYPIKEDDLHKGKPHDSNFGYSYSKRMIEVLGRAYKQQYGIECINICPTNVYGPNDNFNLMDAHVIPSLIHKCYNAVKYKKDFEVFGTGKPLRQFIYSIDLGKIILKLVQKEKLKSNIHNIATPSDLEISIKKVAEIILDSFIKFEHAFRSYEEKSKICIKWDKSKADGQYKKTVCVDRLLDELGEVSYTPIQTGIFDTVTWFMNNNNGSNIRK